jgi:hypothetical protein
MQIDSTFAGSGRQRNWNLLVDFRQTRVFGTQPFGRELLACRPDNLIGAHPGQPPVVAMKSRRINPSEHSNFTDHTLAKGTQSLQVDTPTRITSLTSEELLSCCASSKPGQLWKPFRPTASALVRLRKESVVNGFIGHRVNDRVVDRLGAAIPAHQVGGLDCQNRWLTIEGVRRHAALAMVETPYLGEFNDLSHRRRLNRPWFRGLFAQRQMSPAAAMILKISFQDPSQMRLSKDNHMIEAFPADRSDQPFHIAPLPWTGRRGQDLLYAHALDALVEVVPIDLVPAAGNVVPYPREMPPPFVARSTQRSDAPSR